MIFNDTENLSGICQEADFILGTDANDYPIKEKTRNANRWLDRALDLILRADSKWEFDDDNYTDLPMATTSLFAGRRDYSFSGAGFIKILKVECKDANGNWIPLKQIDMRESKQRLLEDTNETAGTPREFDLRANSIFLYPKPSYSSSGGLKFFYQRVMDYFTPTDTTKEPGFAAPYHRLISYGIAYDYALANNMTNKITLLRDAIAKIEEGLVNHYSDRNKDLAIKMTLAKEDYSSGLAD